MGRDVRRGCDYVRVVRQTRSFARMEGRGEGKREKKRLKGRKGGGAAKRECSGGGGGDTRNKVGHPEFHSSVIQWANWINPPPRLFSLV